jgi:hypothetical protein
MLFFWQKTVKKHDFLAILPIPTWEADFCDFFDFFVKNF